MSLCFSFRVCNSLLWPGLSMRGIRCTLWKQLLLWGEAAHWVSGSSFGNSLLSSVWARSGDWRSEIRSTLQREM